FYHQKDPVAKEPRPSAVEPVPPVAQQTPAAANDAATVESHSPAAVQPPVDKTPPAVAEPSQGEPGEAAS
ncbi:MAG: hypothetical protein ABFC96_06300, partial [Thermoguttaceae bacterium]